MSLTFFTKDGGTFLNTACWLERRIKEETCTGQDLSHPHVSAAQLTSWWGNRLTSYDRTSEQHAVFGWHIILCSHFTDDLICLFETNEQKHGVGLFPFKNVKKKLYFNNTNYTLFFLVPQICKHIWENVFFLLFTSYLTCLNGTEVCDQTESHTSGALKAPLTFHEAFGHG